MTTADGPRTIPAPIVNVESQPFWDAAQERRLLFKHCGACGVFRPAENGMLVPLWTPA